jgi:hypothetical protein
MNPIRSSMRSVTSFSFANPPPFLLYERLPFLSAVTAWFANGALSEKKEARHF